MGTRFMLTREVPIHQAIDQAVISGAERGSRLTVPGLAIPRASSATLRRGSRAARDQASQLADGTDLEQSRAPIGVHQDDAIGSGWDGSCQGSRLRRGRIYRRGPAIGISGALFRRVKRPKGFYRMADG